MNKNKTMKFSEPNNSTMNRICMAFDDIGRINMNLAGVAQFNWQMLMQGPCPQNRLDIAMLFCDTNQQNLTAIIEAKKQQYADKRQLVNGKQMMAEDITEAMIEKCGSLEEAYPYVTKYLFAGNGMDRSSHKEMYWMVFGDLALQYLKKNLNTCDVCKDCGMRIPSWVEKHVCVKNSQGFKQCEDCGAMFERTNGRQCRCPTCQTSYNLARKRESTQKKRIAAKEEKEQRITRLFLSSQET